MERQPPKTWQCWTRRSPLTLSGNSSSTRRSGPSATYSCARTRASYRAMEGWWRVQSQEAWEQTCQEAADVYESGRFLIERLGGERHLDPELMDTLLAVRRQLIDD